MKIEADARKTYRTRGGNKAIVTRIHKRSIPYIVHGGLILSNGTHLGCRWTKEGQYLYSGAAHYHDIVGEWVEPQSAPVAPTAANETSPQDDQSEPVAGYESLAAVLNEALDQASHGKGKERHANGRDFLDQPIMEIGRMVGVGYQTGQAMKKTQEAVGMLNRDQRDRAIAELLGAINYLAAAVILIREGEPHEPSRET